MRAVTKARITDPLMIFDILTIFPNLLQSPLEDGIIKRACGDGKVSIRFTNIRDFATDKHATTDDRPFGGGEGMVMKAEPLAAALRAVQQTEPRGKVILLSPQGRQYTQEVVEELAHEPRLTLICGRYEGIDERFCTRYIDDEISIGDYILTGGELAAMIVVDSVVRMLPGVLGCADSADNDTFSKGLLKHPQYTRPRNFEGEEVPEELLSGDHGKIEKYRFICSVERTLARRPDLIQRIHFNREQVKLLKKNKLFDAVRKIQQHGVAESKGSIG